MKFLSWLKAKWLAVWAFIVKVIQEVAAPITDFENHLDGYKIGGFAAFSLVGYLAIAAVGMADKQNVAGASILATFASLVAGIGYWMFGHAKSLDTTLANKIAAQVFVPSVSVTPVSTPPMTAVGGSTGTSQLPPASAQ
jgi:hypothetical protein